jgi:hypothetical protein
VTDFTAEARESFASGERFGARPLFLTDESGGWVQDETGAGILEETAWSGTHQDVSPRATFTTEARS